MKKLALAAACLISLPATAAEWYDNIYTGAGFDIIDGNETDAASSNVTFRGLHALAGYKYNGWVGGEVRLGAGVSGHEYTTATDTVSVDIDHYQSVYYRLESSNSIAKLYGLLGYSNVQTTSGDVSASDSGPSYGFGVGFVMYENANLNFEYKQILNTTDNEFSAMTIGFDYRF